MPGITTRAARPAVTQFRTSAAQTVIAGPGAIASLAGLLDRLGAERAFVVTGQSVAHRTPLPGAIRAAAGARMAGLHDGISAHTPLPRLIEAIAAARAARADVLVTVGGGSVVDAGKFIAVCLSLGLSAPDDIRAFLAAQTSDPAPVPRMLPHICIPTTASAAEFTRVAGVLDPEVRAKRRLDHPQAVPYAVIQDPEACRHTPPHLFLSSAVRTLDHAVEGLYGPKATAYTDGLAKEAIRLLARAMPVLARAPDDLSAIGAVQAATWTGGYAGNGAGTGLSHGIGYLMGAQFGVPHGECSCVTLAHVVDWNRPAAAPQVAEVARAMGLADAGTLDAEAADRAGPGIGAFVAGLGLPVRARDVTVPGRDALLGLVPDLLALPHVPGSPRMPVTEDEARGLLDRMW